MGFQSELDRPLAKLSQERFVQLALKQGEKMTGAQLGGLVEEQLGGLVGGQLVECQSWPLPKLPFATLFAAEGPLAAEVTAER